MGLENVRRREGAVSSVPMPYNFLDEGAQEGVVVFWHGGMNGM